MDREILSKILENKTEFTPLLFTPKQVKVIEKHLNKVYLSKAEKKSLYTSVTKKVRALETLTKRDNEIYFKGSHCFIPHRILNAKEIIKQFSQEKIFIAGSFLFSEKYNDIDIYIVKERGYKEVHQEEKHIIYLTEKRLARPIFQSTALISIGNFDNTRKIISSKISLHHWMSLYHEAVIELFQNEKKKERLRDLIFNSYLKSKKILLNAKEIQEIIKEIKLKHIDELFLSLCKKQFSKKYLYVQLQDYIKTLKQSIINTNKKEHLQHYKEIYEELIYGKKRAEIKIS